MKMKETIFESIVKYSTMAILGLLGTGLALMFDNLSDLLLEVIYPQVSKKLLLMLLLSSIATIIILSIFTIYLLYKSKPKSKFMMHFGVYWDNKYQAYCPVCKIPLKYTPEREMTVAYFDCPKCKESFHISDDNNRSYTLDDIKKLI